MDRVAEPVVIEHENSFARLRWAAPRRKAGSKRLGEGLALKPTGLISLEPAFEIAERQEQAALAGDRFAAAQGFGGFKGRQRFFEAPQIAQRQRLAAQSRSEAGARGARAAIGVQRLIHAVELQERVAAIDCGFSEVWPQRERSTCGFKRLLEPSEFAKSSGAAAPGVGVVGRKRGRGFECGERFGETAGSQTTACPN